MLPADNSDWGTNKRIISIMYYEDHVKMEAKLAEERGKEKATIEIARNFVKAGVLIDTIVTATGLTKEEVERL